MSILETAKVYLDTIRGIPEAYRERNEAVRIAEALTIESQCLQESLDEIQLAMEDSSWREMGPTGSQSWNFRRSTLQKIFDLSRRMYLMNPLYRRSIDVQSLYVWALGMTIRCKNKDVQQVIDNFILDSKNQAVLTDQPMWAERDREQQIMGNSFIALFLNPETGACRVRILPADQIQDIISNPQDSKEIWYYKRVISIDGRAKILLYPDINYHSEQTPVTYGGDTVEQSVCVLHVKTGGLSEMKFGIPEYLCIINWAMNYKVLLENWATIIKAYASMAMKISGLKDKAKIAAAKSRFQTGVSAPSRTLDNNPPSNVASWFIASGGADVSAVKTAGSTTSAEEGKPLKDMVAAGAGIPSHFYGDADMGNFATSETLDRPTELKFVARQKLWIAAILAIVDKLELWSAQAPNGVLNTAGFAVQESEDPFDGVPVYTVKAPAEADSTFVEVAYPSILERNVTERVRAVVAAATLNGSKAEGIIPDRALVCKMLLRALNDNAAEVDEILSLMYPKPVIQGFIDPPDELEVARIKAQGTADMGQAALDQADTAAKTAAKPAPKGAGSNVGSVKGGK